MAPRESPIQLPQLGTVSFFTEVCHSIAELRTHKIPSLQISFDALVRMSQEAILS